MSTLLSPQQMQQQVPVHQCWQLTGNALQQQQRQQLSLLKRQWRLQLTGPTPLPQQQQLRRLRQQRQPASQPAVMDLLMMDLRAAPAWKQRAVACAHTAAQHAVR
jgi:hypothetical protein